MFCTAALLALLALVLAGLHHPEVANSQSPSLHMDDAYTPIIPSPAGPTRYFLLSSAPLTLAVYVNGLRYKACKPAAVWSCDYTLSGTVLVLRTPLASDDSLVIDTWR